MMANEEDIERRILERMQKLWVEDNRKRDVETYREEARLIIATEDTHETTLMPVEEPKPEPVEPVRI
jgi:hypothetical protein